MPDNQSKQLERKRQQHLTAAEGYLTLEMPEHVLKELRGISLNDIDDPKLHAAVYCLRGEAFRLKSEWEAALDCFEKTCEHIPADTQILMAMAWCFKRLDRLPDAIQAMQQAYELAPTEAIILYNLACYFALSGDKPNTISWLGRAIRLDNSLRNLIPKEPDFETLRQDPDFQLITTKPPPRNKE